MMRRLVLLHPLLFATVPVLSPAAHNPGQYRLDDLITVAAVLLLAAAISLALAALLLRPWVPSGRAEHVAAILVTLGVAWFFFYYPMLALWRGHFTWLPAHDAIPLPLALVATIAAVVLAVRHGEALPAVNRTLTVIATLLVGMQAAQVAGDHMTAARAVARSEFVRSLSAPIRTAPVPPERNTPPRDIYLVVLDARANAAVLRERLGVDDVAFEDSLRRLGFTIPRDMQSNYVMTVVSIPSLLNFEHVTPLARDVGENTRDFAVPKRLVQQNRAARFLTARGYKYVLFPSTRWRASESSPLADEVFDARSGFGWRGELWRTELRLGIVHSSLLRAAPWLQVERRSEPEFNARTLNGLKRLAADPAPTFAFAHFMLPHGPFLVDSTCAPSAHPLLRMGEVDTPRGRAAYLAQVRCANRMVLDFATTVLRESPTPPIILVVSDHGTKLTGAGFLAHPERASATYLRERFGAFGAFYAPAGGDSLFAGRVTLVNVLRQVLRYYFGAELSLAPDHQFVSGDLPYKFYRRDQLQSAQAPAHGPTDGAADDGPQSSSEECDALDDCGALAGDSQP
jgi:hypothetical protein